MALKKCNETTDNLPEGEKCATKQEVKDYFAGTQLLLYEITSFVDYEKVNDKPVQFLRQTDNFYYINPDEPIYESTVLVETEISL